VVRRSTTDTLKRLFFPHYTLPLIGICIFVSTIIIGIYLYVSIFAQTLHYDIPISSSVRDTTISEQETITSTTPLVVIRRPNRIVSGINIDISKDSSRTLGLVANELMRHPDFDWEAQDAMHTIDPDSHSKHDSANTDNFIYGEGTGRSISDLKNFIYAQIDIEHFHRESISFADVWSPVDGDSIIVFRSDMSLMHVRPCPGGSVNVSIDVRLHHFSKEYATSTNLSQEHFELYLRMIDLYPITIDELSPDDMRPIIDWYLSNMRAVENYTYANQDAISRRFVGLSGVESDQMIRTLLIEFIHVQFEARPYIPKGAN
jgi:hypothetical protein